jgi:hypothetical protein
VVVDDEDCGPVLEAFACFNTCQKIQAFADACRKAKLHVLLKLTKSEKYLIITKK